MSKKRKITAPKFSVADAEPDADDMSGQGQSAPAAPAAGGDPSAPTDPSQQSGDPSAQSGQPISFPAEQVAQMEQLKQQQDFAGLGQYVAQFLP